MPRSLAVHARRVERSRNSVACCSSQQKGSDGKSAFAQAVDQRFTLHSAMRQRSAKRSSGAWLITRAQLPWTPSPSMLLDASLGGARKDLWTDRCQSSRLVGCRPHQHAATEFSSPVQKEMRRIKEGLDVGACLSFVAMRARATAKVPTELAPMVAQAR